jgi:hypothetical protein
MTSDMTEDLPIIVTPLRKRKAIVRSHLTIQFITVTYMPKVHNDVVNVKVKLKL